MRLILRLGVLALVLCAVAHVSLAQDEGEDEQQTSDEGDMADHQKSGFARGMRRGGVRRPHQGPRRPGYGGQRGPLRGNRRPAQYAPKRPAYPTKRPAYKPKAQYKPNVQVPRKRPQYGRPQVAIKKPVYGTAQLKPANGVQAQYRYAGPTKRPVHTQQVQQQQVQIHRPAVPHAAPKAAAAISMPTLASLLYKYAKSSKHAIYNSNPYNIFGSKTYGPMPVPKGYIPTTYRKPAYSPKAPVYRPVARPVAQSVSYQKPPQYAAPRAPVQYATPAPTSAPTYRPVYQPAPVAYQPAPTPTVYKQPAPVYRYPVPAPAPYPVATPPPPTYRPVVSYQAPATYQAPAVTSYQAPTYSRAAVQKSYYASPPAVTCPAAGNFCHYKKAGHYSHPGSKSCFIQCDAFGRAYSKPCSPGTSWKPVGHEPALWNMCS